MSSDPRLLTPEGTQRLGHELNPLSPIKKRIGPTCLFRKIAATNMYYIMRRFQDIIYRADPLHRLPGFIEPGSTNIVPMEARIE